MPAVSNNSQVLAPPFPQQGREAFGRLVEQHIDFVYAAASRQTGDPHIAQDITQAVFLLLWQKAGRLKQGTLVKGWLFNTTRFVVANARRAEARRKFHEREAAAMHVQSPGEDRWPHIAPHLDDALAELSEKDRRVLLLRFFEDLPLSTLGEVLGISEPAAQKRVERALKRLRHFLVGRGAAVEGAALGGILFAGIAQAAPVHLVKATIDLALNGAQGAAQSGSAFSLAKGTASLMAAAKIKTIAVIAILFLVIAPTMVIAIHYATSLFAQTTQPAPGNATPAPAREAQRDIQSFYRLLTGSIIKRIVNVPPDVRKRFVQQQFPGPRGSVQDSAILIGITQNEFAARFLRPGTNYSLADLVNFINFARNMSRPEYKIDNDLGSRQLTGDIVFRQDAADDEYSAGLATFIHDEAGVDASVAFRDVPMKVIVLSGHWKFTPVAQAPLADRRDNPCIEIYGDEALNENSRMTSGSTTGREHLARNLGNVLNQKVIFEADRLPESVNIRSYGNVPADGAGRKLVLQHIQEQTGLIWSVETRPVRCLFIDQKKNAP
jgi:RNA polymerase sigma factor (sigma-70 family)